jgi:hypothetical protein
MELSMHRPLALALLTFACAPHRPDTTASAGISETAGAAEPFTGPKTGTGTAPSESVHPASIKTKLNRNIVRNG